MRRSDADRLLDAPVDQVRQVNASRARLLGNMGVRTVRDLLRSYPNRYIDLGNVATAAQAPVGETVTVVGTVDEVNVKQPRPRMQILEVAVFDGTGILMGVWFRQPWMARRFHVGDRVAFTGKVSFDYGFKRMNSPFVEVLGDGDADRSQPGMVPVHHTTQGMTTNWMRRIVSNALGQTGDVNDPLPSSLRRRYRLPSRKHALRSIHFPRSGADLERARRRLAYEEVLYLQLVMMLQRDEEVAGSTPVVHERTGALDALRFALPFELTADQDAAVDEILDDMCAPRVMNRMLLGDVGSGKTVVAAFALVAAAASGHQAAMMAPTEVLARQYGGKVGELLDACGASWATLTGSTDADERERILSGLADGSLSVVFGTHALIEPDVRFDDLSLVAIDEQHRFGVAQRAALRAKGEGCDLLVMTATPIPRTLALTLYGDLETSYIRTRPGSRPPVGTTVISRDARGRGYDAIREAVDAGQQAFIICPLVGLSREQRARSAESGQMRESLSGGADISDVKAAEDEASFLAAKVFPGYRVGLLTGRLKPAEKDEVMASFRSGDIDVLVATTVVEVGVDVPNATVMMVEDAERFGLSQLHQLRGRVGRGDVPGRVFLVADPAADDADAQMRMQALEQCSDGFELAEIDLRARREGDVLGSRQHGASALRLVNVVDDGKIVAAAHADARELLDADPGLRSPEHSLLSAEVAALRAGYDEDLAGEA